MKRIRIIRSLYANKFSENAKKKKKNWEKLWTFIQSTDVTKGTDFRRVAVTVKSQKSAKRQVCSHEHPWPVTSTEFSSLVLGSFLT